MNIKPITYSAALNARHSLPQRQTMPDETANVAAKYSDSVSISQAARRALLAESAARTNTSSSSPLSNVAHEDPGQAQKLAYEYSHSRLAPWLDFSDHINGTGPIRYAATGQPVTEESENYFNGIASAELQDRIDLYDAEKAKGTSDADILDKILGYIDSLPTRYKEMLNWPADAAG